MASSSPAKGASAGAGETGHSLIPEFPDDVFLEIISRLPLCGETLTKMRAVCKKWKKALSGDVFVHRSTHGLIRPHLLLIPTGPKHRVSSDHECDDDSFYAVDSQACIPCGSSIAILGGFNPDYDPEAGTDYNAARSFWTVDPIRRRIIRRADMIERRQDFVGAWMNGKIYALGGAQVRGGYGNDLAKNIQERAYIINKTMDQNSQRRFTRSKLQKRKVFEDDPQIDADVADAIIEPVLTDVLKELKGKKRKEKKDKDSYNNQTVTCLESDRSVDSISKTPRAISNDHISCNIMSDYIIESEKYDLNAGTNFMEDNYGKSPQNMQTIFSTTCEEDQHENFCNTTNTEFLNYLRSGMDNTVDITNLNYNSTEDKVESFSLTSSTEWISEQNLSYPMRTTATYVSSVLAPHTLFVNGQSDDDMREDDATLSYAPDTHTCTRISQGGIQEYQQHDGYKWLWSSGYVSLIKGLSKQDDLCLTPAETVSANFLRALLQPEDPGNDHGPLSLDESLGPFEFAHSINSVVGPTNAQFHPISTIAKLQTVDKVACEIVAPPHVKDRIRFSSTVDRVDFNFAILFY